KTLAWAARVGGRFGKGLLAATLRGSRSSKLAQAGLDQLSTYGILSGMTQDEILLYVDALVAAGCLHVTGGAYPTVSITQTGGEVMRERAPVLLALPALVYDSIPAKPTSSRASSSSPRASSSSSSTSNAPPASAPTRAKATSDRPAITRTLFGDSSCEQTSPTLHSKKDSGRACMNRRRELYYEG